MSIENFKSNCNFYDTIHFRHGFARAGIFTRREADMLSQCGYVIKQLERGDLVPQNADQKSMLNFLNGISEPSSEVEKAWSKYLNAIQSQIKKINGFSSRLDGVDYSNNEGDGAW